MQGRDGGRAHLESKITPSNLSLKTVSACDNEDCNLTSCNLGSRAGTQIYILTFCVLSNVLNSFQILSHLILTM